jgi:hypothetical protein
MADGQYNPFQSIVNPNIRQNNMFDMRMISQANRLESPFERGMRGPSRGGVSNSPMLSSIANMANEPDYSQFTYDPVMRQRAIAAGVQPLEASQVKQNVLLPNTGFFGNHPTLSRMLEAGLFGAAATPSAGGIASTGEGIAAAIEGAIGSQRMRQGMYRQQFARPFEAAGMMEELRDQAQRRELQAMDIEHLRAENQKLGRPDHDFRGFGVSRNDPNIATIDNTTGEVKITPNPTYDPNAAGGNTPEEQFFAAKRAEAKAAGVMPGPKVIASWNKEWANTHVPEERAPHALVGVRDKKGGITYQEARPGSHFDTVPETVGQAGGAEPKATASKEAFIKKELAKPSGGIWLTAGIKPGDKDAAKKLSDYYDNNVAPYVNGGSAAPSGFTKNPDGSYTQN